MSDVIYSIEHLKTYFPVRTKRMIAHEKKFVRAVDDVSLNIIRGETLGIVGESGCGKSTLGRSIVRLVEPTSGRLTYNGIDITKLGRNAMREHRKDLQIMFQDPYASLDPRMTVGNIIAEPLDYMKIEPDKETRLRRIAELMEVCGINKTFINRYPHEFSGGQRQRIGIARALSVFPKLIVCDELDRACDRPSKTSLRCLYTILELTTPMTRSKYLKSSASAGASRKCRRLQNQCRTS